MISWFLETAGRIKFSPKSSFIRRFTNLLYYDPNKVVLSTSKVKVIEMNGHKFYVNEPLEALRDMSGESWLEGTKPDDVILDIGAHIGIMCIPLAKKVKKVYALEPLYAKELKDNVELNGLKNVEVWEVALGNGKLIKLWYRERRTVAQTITLTEIRNKIGQIDFLKSNSEGGEWFVKPREYLGIRELRIDYHIGRKHTQDNIWNAEDLADFLECNGYEVEAEYFSLGLNPQHKGRYQIMASRRR